MTKSIKVKATNNPNKTAPVARLPLGTVVVHNYGEFTHGVICGYADDAYKVYFTADMSPSTPKYQANTAECHSARIRTITHGKGFFVSRYPSLSAVREAQRKYKNRGLALESAQ